MERQGQPDPSELPEDPERSAGEAAGTDSETDDEGRSPPPDDLDSDPAYNPDDPARDLKGG